MDIARLPHYPGEESPPRIQARRRGAGVREGDVLFLVLTTAAGAAPLALLVGFLDSLNDKPHGSHVNAWSYPKVVLVAAATAGLAWAAARIVARPRDRGTRYLLFGTAAVLTVYLSFCLWGRWVFEVRSHTWNKTAERSLGPHAL
jgi:uncharacterized membrane protein